MLFPIGNGIWSIYATAHDGYLTFHDQEDSYVIMEGKRIVRKLTREEAKKVANESPNLTESGKVLFDLQ